MSDNWLGWIDGVEFTSRESALKALGISEPAPTDEKAQWVRCPVCGEEYAVDALMAPTKYTTDEKVLKALGDLRKEQA